MKQAVRETYARHAVELPESETPPTLGLGDPVAIAKLEPGETVLDLGSGPGRDLLESARQVGPTGRAIGVDFTPEMIERARRAASDAGLDNVSILDGDLERLPLHCGAVDVVISNCVINLVEDKRRALIEAYRALRPGGRLAILDTAFENEPSTEAREDASSWSCCVGGALTKSTYEEILTGIGYEDVKLEWQDATCGEGALVAGSVAVTASKPGEPMHSLRPAVPADRDRLEALLESAGLPAEGLRTEDAVVALDDGKVIGAVALERYGAATLLRSLVVDPDHRNKGVGRFLVYATLDVARWSGADEVHLLTEDAQPFFTKLGFQPVSSALVQEACGASELIGCCTTATAMRLSFEEADLPLLSKPSLKPLPTFQNGTCC